jgi:hypothetical protein
MSKIKNAVLFLLPLFLLLPVSLSAKNIGVLPFKPVGVKSNITEAVHQLMGSELSSYGYTVLLPDDIEERLGRKVECYNKECAAEIGKQVGLEKAIFGSLTKIGEKYIVSAVVVESQSGKIVFSDKVTSQTAEDLDVCISRLAKSIEYGKKVEKTAEVGKITEQEVETEAKRKKAFFSSGVGFGMGMPVTGYGDTDNGTINYFEWKGWYETPKFAAEVAWYFGSGTGESEIAEWALGISLLYFFNTTDFSPFISAGLSRKNITFSFYDYSDGLALEAGAGMVIFRTYDFRLVLDGKLSTSFLDVGEAEGPHTALKIGINLLYKREKGGGCLGGGGCGGF